MCDDFSKVFDSIVSKSAIAGAEPERKREYHRDGKMSDYEVMAIRDDSWPFVLNESFW